MDGNLKGCQKKVLQALLHHTTVLLQDLLRFIIRECSKLCLQIRYLVKWLKCWFYIERLLFGANELTKDANPDKWSYFGYVHVHFFLISKFYFCKNVTNFGVDNSSSTHADNRKKYILLLGEDPKQGIGDTKITAEARFSFSVLRSRKKFFICTTMEATAFCMLIVWSFFNLMQKILKNKHIHCVLVIFQKILQLIIWKN